MTPGRKVMGKRSNSSIWKSLPFKLLLLMAILSVGLAIACQSQAPAESPPAPGPEVPEETAPDSTLPAAPDVEVVIESFAFKPAQLSIPAGTRVTWQNNDSVPHTVTERDGLFDSGSLSRGDEFSYTFTQSGSFDYYCTIHPSMTGKVVVE